MVYANVNDNMPPKSPDGGEENVNHESDSDQIPEDPEVNADSAAQGHARESDGVEERAGEAGAVNEGDVAVGEGDANVMVVIGHDERGNVYVYGVCMMEEEQGINDIIDNEIINILPGESSFPFPQQQALDLALGGIREDNYFYIDHQVRLTTFLYLIFGLIYLWLITEASS